MAAVRRPTMLTLSTMQPECVLASDTLDALVVGAGLTGMYLLYQLRKRGLSVKVFEAGSDLGGVWHWNRYPRLRLDSEYYAYQFLMEDLWKDFTWKERFPARAEVVEYINYVDRKLDLRRDMEFNTRVLSSKFDDATHLWTVKTDSGITVQTRFLLLCTGFASKVQIPSLEGLETFEGVCHHTAQFPAEGEAIFLDKLVGVIGTGATGVQVIESAGPLAVQLTVFQRTPQFALPMKQFNGDLKEKQRQMKEGKDPVLPRLLRERITTFPGVDFDFLPQAYKDDSPEERLANLERLWANGGFEIFFAYKDAFFDPEAADFVYQFWRRKTLPRIYSLAMQEKLVPARLDHPIAAKQLPSLEQKYYEVFNQPNVTLVDVQENPIAEVTPLGVKLKDGTEHHLDVLILATGFGNLPSAIKEIDIRGPSGVSLREKWDKGVSSYLGIASVGYPNLFFPVGPHAPTPLANAPTLIVSNQSSVTSCRSTLT